MQKAGHSAAGSIECTEDTPIQKVYELIQASSDGVVVVIDSRTHRKPIGIINEHTICEQLIARGRRLQGATAGSLMVSTPKHSTADGAPAAKSSVSPQAGSKSDSGCPTPARSVPGRREIPAFGRIF